MLKQRVLTASVLAPTVICAVLFLPNHYFALLFGLIALQGSWEWGNFLQLKNMIVRVVYSAIVLILFYICWDLLNSQSNLVLYIVGAAIIWWVVALLLVVLYPKYERISRNRFFGMLAGLLVIVPCWLGLVSLHGSSGQGPALVLYMLMMIWIADIGAYFGGRKWGRNKLSPHVSPNKSWEGVASGMVGVAVFAAIFGAYFQFGTDHVSTIAEFLGISLIVAIFSVLGDLSESMFKRQVGLKDSGNLLPGHGGVLDRIDSVTAAAPVFVICLWLFLGVDLVGLRISL